MSAQMQRSQHSYVMDARTMLKDAGAVTATGAAQVGGANRILDFGQTNAVSGSQLAYQKADLVIDVSALDFGTGDEEYKLVYQLSSSATFASDIHNKCLVPLGNEGGLATSTAADDAAITSAARKRQVVGVDNEHLGVVYRYARVFHVLSGTTPSIDYQAFLGESK